MTRRPLLWGAAWASAAVLLWLAARGVDWRATTAAMRGASPGLLLVAVACNLAILALWAMQWRLVLPRGIHVGYGRMFEIASTASAVMNTVPGLVGHASAVALLVRRGGMPLRAAGSVITLDQVGEGIGKLTVLGAAAYALGLPGWMRAAASTIVVAVVLLVAAVIAVASIRRAPLGGSRPARLLAAIREDLHAVRSPARALGAVLLALAMKAAEAAAIVAVIAALGVDVPPASALVVLGAVNLATMLPVAPANVGVYEAGAVAAYRWLGVSPGAALAAALVQHACFLLPAVGAGVVSLVAVARRPARVGAES